MKQRLFTLAALLLAGAASSALAQDQQIENGGPMYNAARQARERQAQQAPAAPAQAPAQPHLQHGPPGPQRQPPAPQAPRPPQPAQQQPYGWNGPRPQAGQPGRPPVAGPTDNRGDHRDDRRGDRDRDRDRQSWGERGQDHARPDAGRADADRDRQNRDRWDGERRDGDRRDWDRRDGDQRNWNRPGDGRGRDWDRDHGRGPPRDAQRWAPRRYPPIYNSPSRFRGGYWRPPQGYYVRAWRYGEILPRGWYGQDYLLLDWWSYDLPEPPPGYDWVRVGPDALLIDYSGRIVQVVRMVFW